MRYTPTTLKVAAAVTVAIFIANSGSMPQAAETTIGQRHIVEIRKFKFHPAKLDVRPGDTIVWINRDFVPHTATAKNKVWDSKSIAKNVKWETVIKADMQQAYFCRFHPTMKAHFRIVTK